MKVKFIDLSATHRYRTPRDAGEISLSIPNHARKRRVFARHQSCHVVANVKIPENLCVN